MESHIKIVGSFLIALSILHIGFPKRFNWKAELKMLSMINREMMQTHTFFIALFLFLLGILCVSSSHELLTAPLGKRVSLGLAIFWGCRLFFQFFIYSPALWKGKRFETAMHILFSAVWIYFTIMFVLIFLNR